MQVANATPTPALVKNFLALDRERAMTLVLRYRGILTDRGLAPYDRLKYNGRTIAAWIPAID